MTLQLSALQAFTILTAWSAINIEFRTYCVRGFAKVLGWVFFSYSTIRAQSLTIHESDLKFKSLCKPRYLPECPTHQSILNLFDEAHLNYFINRHTEALHLRPRIIPQQNESLQQH